MQQLSFESKELIIKPNYYIDNNVTLYHGYCMDLLRTIPNDSAKLIVTSPPYNLGKEYENKISIKQYYDFQREVVRESYRVLSPQGSICWQVGNYVDNGTILPLDILLFPIFQELKLYLRNRIIWHFGHGLHASKRFSGRYEVILWFTKSEKDYIFNLDAVRIPQKYPDKKHFKGPNRGRLSSNPLGKNPSDVWDIPNVKSNHPEKTIHPCQFPVALIERLVLALTNKEDLIVDPFIGVGTTAVASIMHGRKCAGADVEDKYLSIAKERLNLAMRGLLTTRPMNKPIYEPNRYNYEEKSRVVENNLFIKFA